MKKTLIALVCLIFTANVYGQEVFSGFRLGLTAHPTLGFIKAENGKSDGVSLGFSYGLIGDFNFAENYSFATGLTITTINGKSTEINALPYHVTGANTAYDLKYKMQYIEVPLTVKLKTNKIGDVRWYGQFGLSNDFKIGARQDASVGNNMIADDVNSSDWTRFYRAGLIIGGGAEYDIDEKTSIMAGLSLNNGFTNISTNKNSVRNHYVGINIGVFF
ncbi:porin family protein [Pedobacter namyangjuensis]|uniref:porin family protein n=1 Tax=Pedobacter namyangjuensis TaxID=600626 RepID=UPI000DE2735A|nr:porin family protein [Pedobacter namyangjuensis]